jgi:branched-chain amino acid transport system substrate-binding protein
MTGSSIRTCLKYFALGSTLVASSLAVSAAYAEEVEYLPLQVYRQGPYAAGGTGFFGGMIDYMNLINMRDGGVNGVKLTWSECETGYEVEKGMECYQRMKDHVPPPGIWTPLSVGISYAMTDKVTADKVPLTTINHGRTASSDGRVFKYMFPLLTNSGSETDVLVQYIGSKAGGMDKLKGKKIVILFHGSPYGKETTPLLRQLGEKYGYEVKDIEVPHPGAEQGAQWLEIKRYQPDFVILRGWGIMNPVALKTARKTGYPIDKIVGNIWSNSEEDVKPSGDAGIGYTAITTQLSGTSSPVLQDIIKTVYGAGKGDLADKSRIGSTYHNLGVLNGILTVEAMRKAQAKFGNRAITGDEFRWGLEHLKLDEADVEKLGAKGLMGPSINVTCEDHEGHGLLTFQKWDGKAYHPATDWFKPDWASLRPFIEKESAAYAKEKGITPRDCSKADADLNE